MNRLKNYFQHIGRTNIQIHRKIIQSLFLATTVGIGVQFSVCVSQLERGIFPTVSRPPGIEAFLPISSLISLKYWLVTGIFNRIHPSGLIILTAISNQEYLFHVRHLDLPVYQHSRGQIPAYNRDAWLRMMAEIRNTGQHQNKSSRKKSN